MRRRAAPQGAAGRAVLRTRGCSSGRGAGAAGVAAAGGAARSAALPRAAAERAVPMATRVYTNTAAVRVPKWLAEVERAINEAGVADVADMCEWLGVDERCAGCTGARGDSGETRAVSECGIAVQRWGPWHLLGTLAAHRFLGGSFGKRLTRRLRASR